VLHLIIFMVILPKHELGELARIPQPNTKESAQNSQSKAFF
jgi:hypothetical protein